MSTYDREKAMNFAKANWFKPCEDGLVGLKNEHAHLKNLRSEHHAPEKDWDALFVHDPGKGPTEQGVFRKKGSPEPRTAEFLTFREGDKSFAKFIPDLDDCAHYLSQCFMKGGATIKTQFGVQGLVNSVQDLHDTKTLIEKCSARSAQKLVDLNILQPGDLIVYMNPDSKSYTHSAMYVGDSGITCHSYCRLTGEPGSEADNWDLGKRDGFKYTFVHFSAGDTISPAAAKSLHGWWSVQYGGTKLFVFVWEDGRARRSTVAPRKASDRPREDGEPASWFWNPSSIRLSWQSTGNLEEWTLDSRNAVLRSKLFLDVGEITGSPLRLF